MPSSPADRQALREAAQRATPGPWKTGRHAIGDDMDQEAVAIVVERGGDVVIDVCDCGFDSKRPSKDAAFIALANPAAVLGLLADLDEEMARRERAEGKNDRWKFWAQARGAGYMAGKEGRSCEVPEQYGAPGADAEWRGGWWRGADLHAALARVAELEQQKAAAEADRDLYWRTLSQTVTAMGRPSPEFNGHAPDIADALAARVAELEAACATLRECDGEGCGACIACLRADLMAARVALRTTRDWLASVCCEEPCQECGGVCENRQAIERIDRALAGAKEPTT